MKAFVSLLFIFIFPVAFFAQTDKNERVYLPSKQFKERIVKQEFSDVPQSIRDIHGRGRIVLFLFVDENGNVEEAKLVTKSFEKTMKDYLIKNRHRMEI